MEDSLVSEELAQILSNFPRDFEIISNDNKYQVNKMIVSNFSKKISDLLSNDPNSSTLTIPFSYEPEFFNLVIDFLHGIKISINQDNCYQLNQYAKDLEIKQLIDLTSEVISSPDTLQNVVSRLKYFLPNLVSFNDQYKSAYSFALSNASHFINDPELHSFFNLPYDFLFEFFNDPNVSFKDNDERTIFSFHIALTYPEHISDLINFSEISSNLLKILTTDPKFQSLESHLPLLTFVRESADRIKRIMDQKSQKENEIRELEEKIRIKEQEFKNIQNDLKVEETKSKILSDISSPLKDKLSEIHKDLNTFETTLKAFKISNNNINQLRSLISSFQSKYNEMDKTMGIYLEQPYHINKFAQNGKKLMNQLKENVKSILANCENAIPNEDDINELIEHMKITDNQIQEFLEKLSD